MPESSKTHRRPAAWGPGTGKNTAAFPARKSSSASKTAPGPACPAGAKVRPALAAAQLGLLAALALALSFLEGLLPALPIPGARLGLSNIVIMYVLASGRLPVRPLPAALGITAVKALFALLRGGSAFFMSAAGGFLSTLVMALIFGLFREKISYIGMGIVGAIAHNAGQLLMAMVLLGSAMLYYAPWLLLMALAAGTVTGLTLNLVMPALKKLKV